MAVAPVGRVEEFADAVVAGRHVGRNHSNGQLAVGCCVGAGLDPEARLSPRRHDLGDDGVDRGQRRRLLTEQGSEEGDGRLRTLDLDAYPPQLVAHEAPELEVAGQSVHEGTEAHALYDAGDVEPLPGPHPSRPGGSSSAASRSTSSGTACSTAGDSPSPGDTSCTSTP